MPFLLDTNILSELRKGARCNSNVSNWAAKESRQSHYISVLSLGEIRKGIELLREKSPDKCIPLENWLKKLHLDYANFTIAITSEISERWGELSSRRSLPVIDALLAATALEFGLTLATRNTKDFDGLGIPIVNPFN
ncbi:MAG: type II toxin-antitoxin system VapC family toxin [Proteobacteria bacterium]|jgi:predicted nucleic acid-binding protein|nr:type II toxin-antitoxin system VapC family toxin [Pseudomonadota bacterium]